MNININELILCYMMTTLVEIRNEIKNFYQVSFFFFTSSYYNNLHPLNIVLYIAATFALVAPLLSKATAIASVLLFFFPPTATLFMYIYTFFF